jgi:hypothetical protein
MTLYEAKTKSRGGAITKLTFSNIDPGDASSGLGSWPRALNKNERVL